MPGTLLHLNFFIEFPLYLISPIPYFKPTYKLSSYRFRDDSFHIKKPCLFTFARPDANLSTPKHLQLYCHFEILLDSVRPSILSALEEVVDETTQSAGWDAEIFFFRQHTATTLSYKIALFGKHAPITREKADLVRRKILCELAPLHGGSDFPFMTVNGSRSISKPCPTSILAGYVQSASAQSCAAAKAADRCVED